MARADITILCAAKPHALGTHAKSSTIAYSSPIIDAEHIVTQDGSDVHVQGVESAVGIAKVKVRKHLSLAPSVREDDCALGCTVASHREQLGVNVESLT